MNLMRSIISKQTLSVYSSTKNNKMIIVIEYFINIYILSTEQRTVNRDTFKITNKIKTNYNV